LSQSQSGLHRGQARQALDVKHESLAVFHRGVQLANGAAHIGQQRNAPALLTRGRARANQVAQADIGHINIAGVGPRVISDEAIELLALFLGQCFRQDNIEVGAEITVSFDQRLAAGAENLGDPVVADGALGESGENSHVEKVARGIASGGDLHRGGGEENFEVLGGGALERVWFGPDVGVEGLPDPHGVAVGEIHHPLL
jgi:hypothetical protein